AANEELLLINQELEQYTYIVSHDLQEPIRTIKSFLLLTEKELNGESKELAKTYIHKAIRASNRMRELIEHVLSYAQLEKQFIERNWIHPGDTIEKSIQNLKATIDTSHASISIESEAALVFANKVQIQQVIQNLVTNAIKFTQGRQPVITIRTRRNSDQVQFSVSDNGIGIEKEDSIKIFEIFKRLSAAKDKPGTGIGLAICKKIVEKHGGRIWLESTPGAGTTFHFTIRDPNN
ncbi:MAG: GHKL domain-containing protein, partial [Bacteroidetes bacterium]|nr:GHKL domain-containing protein [Bacteroidota bacterium]